VVEVVAGIGAAAAGTGVVVVVVAAVVVAAAAVVAVAGKMAAAAVAGSHRADSGCTAVVLAEEEEGPVPDAYVDSLLAAVELGPNNAAVVVRTELEAAAEASVVAWVLAVAVAAVVAAAGEGNLDQGRAPALTSARQQKYQRDCLHLQWQEEEYASVVAEPKPEPQPYCQTDQTYPQLMAVVVSQSHSLGEAQHRVNLPPVHAALYWTTGSEQLEGFEL
jgi:hypothetical protein